MFIRINILFQVVLLVLLLHIDGFHGAHVAFGLMWFLTLIIRNSKRGLDLYNAPKFYVASLYWHFIDVVWVFIFTVVYLMGMVG